MRLDPFRAIEHVVGSAKDGLHAASLERELVAQIVGSQFELIASRQEIVIDIDLFAPDMASFHNGRDFAAWLGLVPRQFSSGGKERLGRITKAGQADIRQMLIIGAMSRLNWMGRKAIPESSWLARMMARKPRMLVAIALANKMARQIWAMLTKNEDYKNPMPVMAA